MRRMITENDIKGIDKRIDTLNEIVDGIKEDVDYIKEHLVQYYIHFINVSATITGNTRVDLYINIFNNNKDAYSSFSQLSQKYTSSVRFACSGYIKLPAGTSYPVLSVVFRENTCEVYYYDAQTQSTTYVSVDYVSGVLSDTVKEV